MVEKNPKKMRTQSDYLSDSESLEEETSQHLRTSPEEILYNMIKGSAQCNSTVERGPAKQPKIKKLPKGQALDKLTQMKEKDKPL